MTTAWYMLELGRFAARFDARRLQKRARKVRRVAVSWSPWFCERAA